MSLFDTLIPRVLSNEGGYSNNPKDPGGETMWGITIGFARANGYQGAMRDMTRVQAIELYRKGFWQPINGDALTTTIAFQILDFAVNAGPGTAIRKLQTALGLADDGRWGPISQAAMAAYIPAALGCSFTAEVLDYRRKLSTWPTFGNGWTARAATDLRYLARDIINPPKG